MRLTLRHPAKMRARVELASEPLLTIRIACATTKVGWERLRPVPDTDVKRHDFEPDPRSGGPSRAGHPTVHQR